MPALMMQSRVVVFHSQTITVHAKDVTVNVVDYFQKQTLGAIECYWLELQYLFDSKLWRRISAPRLTKHAPC